MDAKPACAACAADATFLRSPRPRYEALRPRIRVVDLFAGCGGLTLGVAEAARQLSLGVDVRLAVDSDPDAVLVFRSNLPGADVRQANVEDLFDGDAHDPPTATEMQIQQAVGDVDVLVGGPPCQGHSDLNNRTRRADPRNSLYARMARAAEVLLPTIVLIENVPTVTHDTEKVVAATVERLNESGYQTAEAVIDISRLGAPQRRRRHVVLASRDDRIAVAEVIAGVGQRCRDHPVRSVRWAISDLVREKGTAPFDTASTPTDRNEKRIAWLFEHRRYDLPNSERPKCHRSDHSYNSMYGRLRWDAPAQTLTTGFGSMGQGRYVHPSKRRTITPHEAARIQMLPDFWDFSVVSKRGSLATLIGNAVPPILATSLLLPALQSLGLRPATTPLLFTTPTAATTVRRNGREAHQRTGHSTGPPPLSEATSRRMRSVRQTGTRAELAIRSELDRMGLSYTTRARPAETKSRPDLLFSESGIVVMVDGCFWHGCPIHRSSPTTNRDWWQAKLEANSRRDRNADWALHQQGWIVLRFWEHEDPVQVARQIHEFVDAQRHVSQDGARQQTAR